jgi:hypothetical protein
MNATLRAEVDHNSIPYDDKSDTVMTGFNTDDHLEDYEQLLDPTELNEDNKSAKSEGKEAKVPFARDSSLPIIQLGQIDELDESLDDQPDSPEK